LLPPAIERLLRWPRRLWPSNVPTSKTSHSIKKIFVSPFAGKHPKPIQKGTKAAAAEATELAADTEAAAQQEQTERLASEFEALGGGAFTAAQSVAVEVVISGAAASGRRRSTRRSAHRLPHDA
jgi:hypothetical protein